MSERDEQRLEPLHRLTPTRAQQLLDLVVWPTAVLEEGEYDAVLEVLFRLEDELLALIQRAELPEAA